MKGKMIKIVALIISLVFICSLYTSFFASALTYTQTSVCSNKKLSASYNEYYAYGAADFVIPGLNQKMVPQGIDYCAKYDWMFISAYSETSGKATMLFVIDMSTKKLIKEISLKTTSGNTYSGHAGGVAITEKNVYISNSGHLYRIPLSSIVSASASSSVAFSESIPVPVRASFCNYSGGVLWVGDFEYGTSYTTESYRHMGNRDGETYKAWSVGYKLDQSTANELKASSVSSSYAYATPDYILSIRSKVQGMAVLNDATIALSCSYGRTNNSTLYLYNNPLKETPHGTFTANGTKVPVWYLDNKQGYEYMTAPPMLEGVAVRNDMLYVLSEGAANSYRNGSSSKTYNPIDSVWKVNLNSYNGGKRFTLYGTNTVAAADKVTVSNNGTEYLITDINGKTVSALQSVLATRAAEVTSPDGSAAAATDKVGTGYTVTIMGTGLKTVVKGDVDGDAEITANDYAVIKAYFKNSFSFESFHVLASDFDSNGKVNVTDYIKLKRYLAGTVPSL